MTKMATELKLHTRKITLFRNLQTVRKTNRLHLQTQALLTFVLLVYWKAVSALPAVVHLFPLGTHYHRLYTEKKRVEVTFGLREHPLPLLTFSVSIYVTHNFSFWVLIFGFHVLNIVYFVLFEWPIIRSPNTAALYTFTMTALWGFGLSSIFCISVAVFSWLPMSCCPFPPLPGIFFLYRAFFFCWRCVAIIVTILHSNYSQPDW